MKKVVLQLKLTLDGNQNCFLANVSCRYVLLGDYHARDCWKHTRSHYESSVGTVSCLAVM